MVACLSFAIPIWIRNGYRFWIPGREIDSRENVSQAPGKKEVCCLVPYEFCNLSFSFYLDKCGINLFNLFVQSEG
jgi:hypothetical protein